MGKETKKYTAAELVDMIRSKYSESSAYTVLEQVASGTGGDCYSWVDAAVFSLWPSKGLWRAAYEVKVSRADWLKEMSQPGKNEWAREHFDFFWYVVAPGIVKDGECPESCGLMVVRGNGLTIAKQAPRRADVKTDASVIASFARSLDKEMERFRRHEVEKAIQRDYRVRDATIFQDGCKQYIEMCNEYLHPKSAQEVVDKLVALARSPEAKHEQAEAEQVLDALEDLQDHVIEFLTSITPFAAHLLNARDEAAKFIVRRYGKKDPGDLREILKKASKHDKETISHKLAVREILAEHADKAS